MRSRLQLLAFLVPATALLATGCYDPPVRESVTVTLEAGGRLRVAVETTFKQGDALKPDEVDRIQRTLDLYDLGRDPWLRGFERAAATEVSHECHGAEGRPEGIARAGTIPSVESLVEVMPDAIADFKMIEDPKEGTRTLRFVHIDLPESLRDGRRRLEREIEAFARVGFRFAESQCDLYDYLAGHPDRRRDLLRSLDEEEQIEGILTPEETVLRGDLLRSLEALLGFGEASQKDRSSELTAMSFSAFEHDFCVKLPVEAIDALGLVRSDDDKEKTTWCVPRLTWGDLTESVSPEADPPLGDDAVLDDEERLMNAPFTCSRYDDSKELERVLWDRILPLPYYELTWGAGAPEVKTDGNAER